MIPTQRPGSAAALIVLSAVAALMALVPGAGADVLPSGFDDTTVFSGLQEPTKLRFAPDGRAFIAERKGKILVFDSLSDSTPTVFADLSEMAYDKGDRGILGMALDPKFDDGRPYVYVLYTYNHLLGEEAPPPKWEGVSTEGDPCPPVEESVELAEKGMDCPVSGRLIRLTAEGDHAKENAEGKPDEEVLVEDWCQQYDSHSIGDLQFDSEGNLYASAGEGASYTSPDYGQEGLPEPNQCGDPPGEAGEALTIPTAEGGSLRAQDPKNLDGTVIRVNPDTGQGLPGNPLYSSSNEDEKRVVAEGFRNPFRFAIDPVSHEVYVGNVGWSTWEEIDRFAPPAGETPSQLYNSGWPCYEGPEKTQGFDILGLDVCEALYSTPGSTSPPFYAYRHGEPLTPYDPCETQYGSVINALSFYEGSTFPSAYHGALFFADGARQCIYVMFPGEDGRPDPSTVTPFLTYGGLYPTAVDLEEGPEGDLYYVDLFGPSFDANGGSVHRISYSSGNQPPVARLSASREYGPKPLEVEFDASGSTDPDGGEELTYEWDLEGDGEFKPGGSTATKTFEDEANHAVTVRVEDEHGATSMAEVTVYPGDTPPVPEIIAPSPSLKWHVGESIEFEGAATDAEEGSLLPTSLDWNSLLKHCPSACHVHPLQAFPGVASGTIVAPEHDYPSGIELTLTATDSRGLSASQTIELEPEAVELGFGSVPSGVGLSAGLVSEEAPFSFKAIKGSNLTLVAPTTTTVGGKTYAFKSWSDEGARVHAVTANASATYTAEFEAPTASLATSQSWSASGGLEVELDASGSSGEGLQYEWDTGSGFEAGSASKAIAVADESPHTVRVRVEDSHGGADEAEETIEAVELQLHSSPAGVSLKAGTVEKAAPFAIFALKGSSVGLSAPEALEEGSTTYAFKSWSDEGARTHSITADAPVAYSAEYEAPQAQLALAASPQSWNGEGDLEVELDASGSSGEGLQYEWDTGSGFEAATSESTRKALVESAGEATVKVRVEDSSGATDVAEKTIDVVGLGLRSEPSAAPLKAATVEKAAPFTLLALRGSELTLGAPSSFEEESTTYDFSSWSDGGARTHPVTATSSATYTAHFTEYVAPVASLASPTQGWSASGGLEVELDASGSSGGGLSYEWDTGSGFEAGSASKAIAVADESPHTVRVRVEDSHGGADEAEETIEAVELQLHSSPAGVSLKAGTVEKAAPFAIFALKGSSVGLSAPEALEEGSTTYAFKSWSDEGARTHSITADAPVAYSAEYEAPQAQLALAASPQSWNGEGDLEVELDASGSSGEGLQYEWDTGSGFEAGSASKAIAVTDESPHTVRVRVKEPSGATDVAEETVQAVKLNLESSPAGVSLKAGTVEKAAPFEILALKGSSVGLSAPEALEEGSTTYAFSSWSDGRARAHTVQPAAAATYLADFTSTQDEAHAEPPPSETLPSEPLPSETRPDEPVIVPPLMPLTAKIVRGPQRVTRRAFARFVLSSRTEGVVFHCRLDRRPFHRCHSPVTFRHLRAGRHVFRFYDSYRGERSRWVTYRWRILTRQRRHGRHRHRG